MNFQKGSFRAVDALWGTAGDCVTKSTNEEKGMA